MPENEWTRQDKNHEEHIWFPHFARCLEPMFDTDVKRIMS